MPDRLDGREEHVVAGVRARGEREDARVVHDGLPDGRRVGGGVEDGGRAHRAGEAADPEPGRDAEVGAAVAPVQGHRRVLLADDQGRGSDGVVAGQHWRT